MHEYAILESLLARVAEEAARAGALAVRRVELRIGELAGLDAGLFRSAWDVLGKRGLTARAELIVTPVAVAWACRSCTMPLVPGAVLRCPACGDAGRLVSGDEIILDRLELEVSDV